MCKTLLFSQNSQFIIYSSVTIHAMLYIAMLVPHEEVGVLVVDRVQLFVTGTGP